MDENGNVTMEDLKKAIDNVAEKQDSQYDELKRDIAEVKCELKRDIAEVKEASATAHTEIIARLQRLEGSK